MHETIGGGGGIKQKQTLNSTTAKFMKKNVLEVNLLSLCFARRPLAHVLVSHMLPSLVKGWVNRF